MKLLVSDKKYKDLIYSGIIAYYEELKAKLEKSAELNFKRWDILDKQITFSHKPCGSWIDEVNCDIDYFKEHMDWLDLELTHNTTNCNYIIELQAKPSKIYNIYGQQE